MRFFWILALLLSTVFPPVPAPDWYQKKTLGKGKHAKPEFKQAAAKAHKGLQTLFKDKVLAKGKHFKTRFPLTKKSKTRLQQCIAYLLGIAPITVERCVNYLASNTTNEVLELPKKRGRGKLTKQQYQEKYGNVYNAILSYLQDARKNGETATVDKLLEFLRKEEPGRRVAAYVSYSALRYYLIRMGFKHGRISRKVSSGRYKSYVIAWLISYCTRRAQFARNPTAAQLKEVHFYVDESFIYRNDSGNFSYYVPGEQSAWGKAKGNGQRWGLVHGVWSWWEPDSEDGKEEEPPRKRRKKENPPDPKVPGYTRKFRIYEDTLHVWNCANKNNMNTKKFLDCLHKVCGFFDKNFPRDCKLVIHMDNASYHKTKNPEYLDLSSQLTQEQVAAWIVKHAPAEYGFDDLESLQDENGDFLPMKDLKDIVNNVCANHPNKCVELVKDCNDTWEIEFTPPYWSHVMPVEFLWNNFKLDYRGWDSNAKVARVNESVKKFMDYVVDKDVEGFIRHTDDFCFKIADKDDAFLKSYEIEL